MIAAIIKIVLLCLLAVATVREAGAEAKLKGVNKLLMSGKGPHHLTLEQRETLIDDEDYYLEENYDT